VNLATGRDHTQYRVVLPITGEEVHVTYSREGLARLMRAGLSASDEGRPFGFGNQVLIQSHRKVLWSKTVVVSVAEKPGQPAGMIVRGQREQTADEVSKADWGCQNRGMTSSPGSAREVPETAREASGM